MEAKDAKGKGVEVTGDRKRKGSRREGKRRKEGKERGRGEGKRGGKEVASSSFRTCLHPWPDTSFLEG